MPNIKYTHRHYKYISDNYNKVSPAVICKALKMSIESLREIVYNLRKNEKYHQQYPIEPYSGKKGSKLGYKKCTQCKKEKPEKDFGYRKHLKGEVNNVCKSCCTDNKKENALRAKRYHRDKKLQTADELILTDESLMPSGVYKDCRMDKVPAGFLIEMAKKQGCDIYVKDYVERNMETLEMQNKYSNLRR